MTISSFNTFPLRHKPQSANQTSENSASNPIGQQNSPEGRFKYDFYSQTESLARKGDITQQYQTFEFPMPKKTLPFAIPTQKLGNYVNFNSIWNYNYSELSSMVILEFSVALFGGLLCHNWLIKLLFYCLLSIGVCFKCGDIDTSLVTCEGNCSRTFHKPCFPVTQSDSTAKRTRTKCPECSEDKNTCSKCQDVLGGEMMICSMKLCLTKMHLECAQKAIGCRSEVDNTNPTLATGLVFGM